MNLTQFFLKPNNETDYPSIYAISNDKELIKEFKNSRNMNKFIIRNIKISKEEFNSIKKKHLNYFLKKSFFKTYNMNSSLPKVVHIITTYKEELDVFQKSDVIITSYLPDFPDEMYTFNDNITEILKKLVYYNMLSFYAVEKKWQYENMIYFENDIGEGDYEYTGDDFFEIDELNLFIKLYGDTLKMKD